MDRTKITTSHRKKCCKFYGPEEVQSKDHMPERIGQLYSIHPTQIELYALWLLLNHVKGPKNYKNIQTVKGIIHDSFKEAAIALGLVKDDYIWI